MVIEVPMRYEQAVQAEEADDIHAAVLLMLELPRTAGGRASR
jgi:hypothetical protein